MTHTKGPWTVQLELDQQEWVLVLDKSFGVVANVNTETGPDATSAPAMRQMPAFANARLIAAAPDLLEACKLAQERLTVFVQQGYGAGFQIEKLRAAIAKAEGGDA